MVVSTLNNKKNCQLQYRIFNRAHDLIEFWENKLGIEWEDHYEVWDGFDEPNEILELDYIYNWKGSVGVDGIPKQLISNSDLKKEQIEIKRRC